MYYILVRPIYGPGTALACLLFFGLLGIFVLSRPDPQAEARAQQAAQAQRLKESQTAFARECYLLGLKEGDNFPFHHPLVGAERCTKEASEFRTRLGSPDPKEVLALRRKIWTMTLVASQEDVDYWCKQNGWPAGYIPPRFTTDLYSCFKKHPEPT